MNQELQELKEEQQELYDNLIARLEHINNNWQEQLDKVVNGGSVCNTTVVGASEDAGCCVLKRCRHVSIVGINVFFNLCETEKEMMEY
jgi:hypothetical protein